MERVPFSVIDVQHALCKDLVSENQTGAIPMTRHGLGEVGYDSSTSMLSLCLTPPGSVKY